MARAGGDDHRRPVDDLAPRVEITVIPGPDARTPRKRIGPVQNRKAIGCLVAALAAGAFAAENSLTRPRARTEPLPTTVPPNTVLHPTYLRPTDPGASPIATATRRVHAGRRAG